MSFEKIKKLHVPQSIINGNCNNSFRSNINFWSKELKKFNKSINEMEKSAFTVDGVELGAREKIGQEYIKLTATLAFDSDLETDEYSDVNKILRHLGELVNNLDDDEIMYDAIKKLIVYLDMQIGCKVSFYSTFSEMLLSGELEYGYHKMKEMGLYNYKSLVTFFYDRSYMKIHSEEKNIEDQIVYDNKNIKLKVTDWLNQKRIGEIVKAIEKTKEIDIHKYYNFKDILREILEMLETIESKEDITFVRKVLAYLEYSLGIKMKDHEESLELIKEEIKSLRERTIFNEDIDLDFLKEKFHYEGKLRKRRGG